jgi:hypothetical protein
VTYYRTRTKPAVALSQLVPLLCLGLALSRDASAQTLPGLAAETPSGRNVASVHAARSEGGVALAPAALARLSHAYAQMPLRFEANRGQTAPQVKFIAHGSGTTLFLTPDELVWLLQKPDRKKCHCRSTQAREAARTGSRRVADPPPAVLRMRLAGANPHPQVTNPHPQVTGEGTLPGRANYYTGPDWRRACTDIPAYERVRARAVYPGVDMLTYGSQHQLEYDFIVAPHAAVRAIRLAFPGAERVAIDRQGDLALTAAGRTLRIRRPDIYQQTPRGRKRIAGRYAFRGRSEVGFQVAAYDRNRPLVIDPVVVYSTYLGARIDHSSAIAVDRDGNAYITGYTYSLGFPTKNAVQPQEAGAKDAFVAKFNAAGTDLVYSTYLGGPGDDSGNAIAVDAEGNAYVTGFASYSTDYPDIYEDQRVFVAKLDPNGALLYSTSILGSGGDSGNGIAVDSLGYAYVTGNSAGGFARGFPIWRGFQTEYGGAGDAFVMVLTPDGTGIVYSTYIGGALVDEGTGIALDPQGYIYVTGLTGGGILTTPDSFRPAYQGGFGDAYVIKIDPSKDGAASMVYGTYLGGDDFDQGNAIAVDAEGCAYIAGSTKGGINNLFPATAGAYQTEIAFSNCSDNPFKFYQCDDAFVTKLNAAGSGLVYSTYLGGKGTDYANGIAVDAEGCAYVVGQAAPFFPTVQPFQDWKGGTDAFVTKISADGSTLIYSSFLGGSGSDTGQAIAVDQEGSAYVTGTTSSADFPTQHAFQPGYRGIQDGDSNAYVVKIGVAAATATASGAITLPGAVNRAQTIAFTFRPQDGSAAFTRTATLAADGTFSLTDVPQKNYTVHVKGSKWLAKNVSVDASHGSVPGVNATLLPGDINNDNKINITDLGLLADAFNSMPTSPNWNPNADLNGDNKVNISDLGLLADNFNRSGDP